jgi:hypothetical protein
MDQTWRAHYKYKNYAADLHGHVKNVKTNSIIYPINVRDNIYVLNLYEEGSIPPGSSRKQVSIT